MEDGLGRFFLFFFGGSEIWLAESLLVSNIFHRRKMKERKNFRQIN